MSKEKEIDDLFKKKLEDPVDPTVYKEADWDALEGMLDKQKKRKGIVFWLPVLSGAAALLLLFTGWWIFGRRPIEPVHHSSHNSQLAAHQQKENTGINGGSTRQQPVLTKKTSTPASFAVNPVKGKRSSSNVSFFSPSAYGSRRTAGPDTAQIQNKTVWAAEELLISETPVPTFTDQPIIEPVMAATLVKNTTNLSPGPIKKGNVRPSRQAFRPTYALSVLAAPDINGVGGFQQSKVGTNAGLLFTAGILKKLTISTGAIYSVKPYLTPFEDYHTPYQFKVSPVNVTADCRMLDIPLNIGYQIYNKHQNQISLGTGLSSYIMLHESYKFNYANTYVTGPENYTVPNSNKYFFGILNLNATYLHQVNSNMGISVQPYVKLPLSNIGYSQVRLQTTGVAIGLTWNLNPLSKP